MNRKELLSILLFVSSITAGYTIWMQKQKENIYQSLDNVFLEINYAATDRVMNRFNLPNPSTALNSDDLLDIEDKETMMPLLLKQTNLPENEAIFVIVGIEKIFVLHHRTLLAPEVYLHSTYTYRNKRIIGNSLLVQFFPRNA